MLNLLAGLAAVLQLLVPMLAPQLTTQRLRSGEWLRFHVIAQDDTQAMQRIKLCVRDAVQDCCRQQHTGAATMLEHASLLLPTLTQAAKDAARREGFDGEVSVALDFLPFDDRTLWGMSIPAGDYPALIIRLGEAKGRNWWGLLDPELSFRLALCGEDGSDALTWDWSLEALLAALFGLPMHTEGA